MRLNILTYFKIFDANVFFKHSQVKFLNDFQNEISWCLGLEIRYVCLVGRTSTFVFNKKNQGFKGIKQ